jgi:hypothetical protein
MGVTGLGDEKIEMGDGSWEIGDEIAKVETYTLNKQR